MADRPDWAPPTGIPIPPDHPIAFTRRPIRSARAVLAAVNDG